MTTSEQIQRFEPDTCPACGGVGQRQEKYTFKPRHRYDVMGESQLHAEPCGLCGGGPVTRAMLDEWQTLQSYPACPSCGGTGGKRTWRWGESEDETERVFSFASCGVCGGKGRVPPDARQRYESQRRQIQFVTLVGVLAVVGFGLWGATALVSAVISRTPAILCCPLPIIPGAGALGLIVLKGLL
jgi:hypothetical protein